MNHIIFWRGPNDYFVPYPVMISAPYHHTREENWTCYRITLSTKL